MVFPKECGKAILVDDTFWKKYHSSIKRCKVTVIALQCTKFNFRTNWQPIQIFDYEGHKTLYCCFNFCVLLPFV